MYTEFYKLKDMPFQLGPDPRFFYGSSVHKKAMAYLAYGLEQGEGFIVITGEVGAGKSTLVAHLLSSLDSTKFVAAKIVMSQLDADNMLRMVASAYNLGFEGADKATLLHRLQEFFIANHKQGRRCLLIVDEVQNLTVGALEELRMLSNVQVGQRTLLQSFLVGQPEFRQTFSSSELEQLRQRVTAYYHLAPLDLAETHAYIEHRLRTVGWNEDPRFTDDAFQAIFERTEGVPRRINTLCARLLLYGFLEELHEINGTAARQVAEELSEELAPVPAMPLDAIPGAVAQVAPVTVQAQPNPALPPAVPPPAAALPSMDMLTVNNQLLQVMNNLMDMSRRLAQLEGRMAVVEGQLGKHEARMRQMFQAANDYLERTKA
jgi:putative secretion ATPase (PEP-CTERM system associated)